MRKSVCCVWCLKTKQNIYLLAPGLSYAWDLSCGVQTFSCGMWDLVPGTRDQTPGPALGAESALGKALYVVFEWRLAALMLCHWLRLALCLRETLQRPPLLLKQTPLIDNPRGHLGRVSNPHEERPWIWCWERRPGPLSA